MYLLGGILSLVAMAFYFALMAVFWTIALVVTVVGSLIVATVDYFTDENPNPEVNVKKFQKYYKQFEVGK